MFVMQITLDDDQDAPKNAFTPECAMWNALVDATNDNAEHDSGCTLANEEAYYVWSESEEKLNDIYASLDTKGFYTIITDDPDHLNMPTKIPSWSSVKAI